MKLALVELPASFREEISRFLEEKHQSAQNSSNEIIINDAESLNHYRLIREYRAYKRLTRRTTEHEFIYTYAEEIPWGPPLYTLEVKGPFEQKIMSHFTEGMYFLDNLGEALNPFGNIYALEVYHKGHWGYLYLFDLSSGELLYKTTRQHRFPSVLFWRQNSDEIIFKCPEGHPIESWNVMNYRTGQTRELYCNIFADSYLTKDGNHLLLVHTRPRHVDCIAILIEVDSGKVVDQIPMEAMKMMTEELLNLEPVHFDVQNGRLIAMLNTQAIYLCPFKAVFEKPIAVDILS